MKEKPKLTVVNSYDELKALVPGYKTKVKIDSDRDSEWMIYKGTGLTDKSDLYSFIEVPDTIETDTEFIVWSSWDEYLSFPGDECITPDLRSSIVFNSLHRRTNIIRPGSKEYEEVKSLVEPWIKDEKK